MQEKFGAYLKNWRLKRRLSQLDLSLLSNVSSRHISFLETGRSKPSRSMVLALCDSLEVPLFERNTIFMAAGFSPLYQNLPLDNDAMKKVQEAVSLTLANHHPYPAFALDRHWKIVEANQTGLLMLSVSGLKVGDGLLTLFQDKQKIISLLENWQETVFFMTQRLKTESAHLGGDDVLDNAVASLQKMIAEDFEPDLMFPPVIPARYRFGGQVLSFFSTLTQFGSAQDITLCDMKIEMLFPADEETKDKLLTFVH